MPDGAVAYNPSVGSSGMSRFLKFGTTVFFGSSAFGAACCRVGRPACASRRCCRRSFWRASMSACDQDEHAGDTDHGLDGRVLLLVLDLEAHALLVDPHLAFDAGAALCLLQSQVAFAFPVLLRFAGLTRAFGLVTNATIFR